MQSRMKIHLLVARPLREFLASTGTRRVIDLGSGSGGLITDLAQEFRAAGFEVEFTLTDRYPNNDLGLSVEGMTALTDPIDARDVPRELSGCRTLFNAFHHFDHADAITVLKNAVDVSQPICVFEIADRRFVNVLGSFLIPAIALVITPVIRPWTLGRFVFTYLVPLVPFVCWWDGLVSQLRAYTSDELLELASKASCEYEWKSGMIKSTGTPIRITYLTGYPKLEPGEDTEIIEGKTEATVRTQ